MGLQLSSNFLGVSSLVDVSKKIRQSDCGRTSDLNTYSISLSCTHSQRRSLVLTLWAVLKKCLRLLTAIICDAREPCFASPVRHLGIRWKFFVVTRSEARIPLSWVLGFVAAWISCTSLHCTVCHDYPYFALPENVCFDFCRGVLSHLRSLHTYCCVLRWLRWHVPPPPSRFLPFITALLHLCSINPRCSTRPRTPFLLARTPFSCRWPCRTANARAQCACCVLRTA